MTRARGRRTRDLVEIAAAVVGAAAAAQIPVYTHSHDGRLCSEKHDELAAYPNVPNWCDARTGSLDEWRSFADEHSISYPVDSTRDRIVANVQRWILDRDRHAQRHDGDCQAFQHTYVSQGEPGVFAHGPTPSYAADVVGTNGRRLLVRDDADGVYVGGALLTNEIVLDLIDELQAMVMNRRNRGVE